MKPPRRLMPKDWQRAHRTTRASLLKPQGIIFGVEWEMALKLRQFPPKRRDGDLLANKFTNVPLPILHTEVKKEGAEEETVAEDSFPTGTEVAEKDLAAPGIVTEVLEGHLAAS
ncbi:hypothetical protein U1Q18_008607 [Sarracenia purpurea var. burkii]